MFQKCSLFVTLSAAKGIGAVNYDSPTPIFFVALACHPPAEVPRDGGQEDLFGEQVTSQNDI